MKHIPSNYYTKNETYTKTETDDKFALKERTYTKSECDGLFAYRNDTYTKPQCDMKYVNNDNYVIFTLGNRLDGRCTLNSVCYGNNMFVTVGFEGICAWSRNGNMYTKGTISNNVWKSVCYGNNLFVAVGDDACAWSEDGYTFTDGTISSQKWIGICYGNGIYAAVSTTGCATSTDGKVFEDGNSYTFECTNVVGICYGMNLFVLACANGIFYSSDGKTYTKSTVEDMEWNGICYGNNLFVAVSDSYSAYSEDGKTFTRMEMDSNTFASIAYGNNVFLAVSMRGGYSVSYDGKIFKYGGLSNIAFNIFRSICYSDESTGVFSVVGGSSLIGSTKGTFATARDFLSKNDAYKKYESDEKYLSKVEADNKYVNVNNYILFSNLEYNDYIFSSVCYYDMYNRYVAVSTNGKCAWSSNGNTYTKGTISNNVWRCVCRGDVLFVAVGDNACAWSEDGITFTDGVISNRQWHSICYGYGKYVAVSTTGCATSTDGKVFEDGNSYDFQFLNNIDICYGMGLFLVACGTGIYYSSDGLTFTKAEIDNAEITGWCGICYGKVQSTEGEAREMFVAFNMGHTAYSYDGMKFTTVSFTNNMWVSMVYGNGVFLAVSMETKYAFSCDGKTFTVGGDTNSGYFNSICYGNEMFVAVGGRYTSSTTGKFVTARDFLSKVDAYTKEECDEKFALKKADSLNVVHNDRTLTITGDTESNKFNVDITTTSNTTNIMQIGLGKVDFGYNQIRTQHLVLAGQSLQQIIRSDMSKKPKATDVSLYTALMIDNNFYNKTEVDTKISDVKNELPEEVDLSGYVTNDGLTNKLSSYYTNKEADDKFVINDYGNELSFTDGGTIDTFGWYSVCYGNGMFVAVSYNDNCAWSTDVKTFTLGKIGTGSWYSVCYGNGMFVTVSDTRCAWSSDGKTFTNGTITENGWQSVCYGNGMFVAVSYGKCAWSTDGKTFTLGKIGTGSWQSVCYGNGMFVTVSRDGKCAWSTDGKTFTYGTITENEWYSVCYGNGMFVAVSYKGKCAWSSDVKTFTDGTITENRWRSVCYGNGMFVAVGYGKCAWSTDGKTFTDETSSNSTWVNVCYGNGMFITVDENGKFAWSEYRLVTAKSFALKDQTYTKTEIDKKINEGVDSLWTLENGQTLSYTNPNADTNYPAVSLRHDAISQHGNLNCSVLRLINERDNNWAPFVMFAGKNNKRLGEIIYNPMIGYIAIESGLNSLSSVRMYLEEDKVSIQNLVNYSNVPYALQTYSYSKAESDTKYALKTKSQQSMTITHLAPIDEECSINEFIIGTPVYMTGKVYVKDWENNIWNKSTTNDSIDCISSVKTNGTWKEYLGICTSKTDKENGVLSHNRGENGTEPLSRERVLQTLEPQSGEAANEVLSRNCGEIRFASHGDYMIKVSNSSEFKVGDIVYLNENGEGKLEFKVLTEDVVLTAKINNLTVGKVTGIIDETTLSVFKA